jgi:hypothetical protein
LPHRALHRIAFGGNQGLFLSGRRRRAMARHIVAGLSWTP